MNRGYICIAQNNEETNYVRLAYGLALSIKNSQAEVKSISIVTDCSIPDKYKDVFDFIIPIEKDRAHNSKWKLHNIVDLYNYSPYDESIILDSDMLFLTDVSHWWDKLSERNFWFTSNVKNYRGETIPQNTIYRQEFLHNNLPNIYMAYSYFKKSEMAQTIFDLTKHITENWHEYVATTLHKMKPKIYSTDVAFALAIKLLGLRDQTTVPQLDFPTFTHMKTQNQNWRFSNFKIVEDWTRYTPTGFDRFNNTLGVKIGTIRQTGILHYHVKHFLTDEMIELMENI